MAEYLVIRLGSDPESSVSWIAVDSQGTRRSNVATGSLSQAAVEIRERQVIVLVPATDVLTTSVLVPTRGGSRLLAVLPFALEEQLADDVETLHFAPGNKSDNGRVQVAIVSRETMSGWMALLAEAGVQATRLVPENHGLGFVPNTLSMLVSDDLVAFNDGDDLQFVMQGVKPSEALAAAGVFDDSLADDDESPVAGNRHLVAYCEPGKDLEFEQDWTALRHDLDGVDVNVLSDGVLPRLAITVATGAGTNLLQGRYGPKTEIMALIRPWRIAATLLLALVGVGIVAKAVDYYRLTQEAAALQQQFTAEYRQLQPDSQGDVLDPVNAVLSLRRAYGSSSTATPVFLPSIEALAMALVQYDAAEIEAISYRAGVVDVRIEAPDVTTLNAIRQEIAASGRFNASIQSTDQGEDSVSSRIRISEGGA